MEQKITNEEQKQQNRVMVANVNRLEIYILLDLRKGAVSV